MSDNKFQFFRDYFVLDDLQNLEFFRNFPSILSVICRLCTAITTFVVFETLKLQTNVELAVNEIEKFIGISCTSNDDFYGNTLEIIDNIQ